MYKKCKAVMLPTNEKATNIVKLLKDTISYTTTENIPGGEYQHLYIVSDDKVQEDDWVIQFNAENSPFSPVKYRDFGGGSFTFKKVLATTDSSLVNLEKQYFDKNKERRSALLKQIKVPQPTQSFVEMFIEEFNKGNAITDVLVEYKGKYRTNPDGEPIGLPVHDYQPKVNSKDNTITIKKVKDSWSKEEVENLIKSVVKEISYGNEELLHHYDGDFRELDKWIEENL